VSDENVTYLSMQSERINFVFLKKSILSIYKKIVFPVLSQIDPEKVHYWAMGALVAALKMPIIGNIIKSSFNSKSEGLERDVFGLRFKNPLGLAAGFDKNAQWVDELATLGFGFIEIGTVTPKAQDGNAKPRLFRLKKDLALINRMGFNNGGVDKVVENLKKRKSDILVGGNIGKNKLTPNENALSDYQITFRALFDYVDYFVVNVSSPNTPGLRDLQEKGPLTEILVALQTENGQKDKPKPILLKIAPDLTDTQLEDIVEIVNTAGIAGVIATNTTLSRADLQTSDADVAEIGAGGLSGKPLTHRATEVVEFLHTKSMGSFDIIGVGGIYTGKDAEGKFAAGAKLVQVYSGFVYEGPSIAKNINAYLTKAKL
jgi:dihydroorotate dehydrogenase